MGFKYKISEWWDENEFVLRPLLVIVPVLIFVLGLAIASKSEHFDNVRKDASKWVNEITVRNETHEYIVNEYGITHPLGDNA